MATETFYVKVIMRGYKSLAIGIPAAVARRARLMSGMSVRLEWDGKDEFKCTVLVPESERPLAYVDDGAAEISALDTAEAAWKRLMPNRNRDDIKRELLQDVPEEPNLGETFR